MCRQLENESVVLFYFLMLIQERKVDKKMQDAFFLTKNLPGDYVYLEGVLPLKTYATLLRQGDGMLLCMLPKDFPRPKLSDYRPLLEVISRGSF